MAYAFVDTTQTGDSTGQMSIQTIFNKINLDAELTDENGEFTTLTVSGRRNTMNTIKTLGITGMHGEYEQDYHTVEPRTPTVKFRIRDNTNEGFAERLTRLNSLLRGVKQTLTFADEPMTYYATVAEIDIPEEESNDLIGTITFFCSDPFKYGAEEGYVLSDATTIVNKGSVESEPIIELTALKKTTFAMVTNGDEVYNLIGKPADADEKIINEKNLMLKERGESLQNWSKVGTQIDNGKVTGEMGTDGTGIHPMTYGTKPRDFDGWYGPALMKEIPPIQDFMVDMRLRAETSNPNQLYRIEFYLYDENMNVIGKMAVRDYALNTDRYAGEGRMGKNKAVSNYAISRHNYLKMKSHFHGMVRMKRRGSEFEFYIARLKTADVTSKQGYHWERLRVKEQDVNKDNQGKLKFIQINILRHTEGRSANVPRINAIEVYEYNTVKVDETPYVLDVGDIVTFDHENDDILINGEPQNELKDFGGQFFKLDKGINNIFITPENSFDGTIRFRPKHL